MRNIFGALAVFCLFSIASSGFACESDAECGLDQICDDAGRCVPDGRDWKDLKKALIDASSTSSQSIENVIPTEANISSAEAVQLMPKGETSGKSKAVMKSTKAIMANNDLRACGMFWHRDEARAAGLYSVWRPTKPVYIIVNLTRKGKFVGSIDFTIRPPNQEISLLINQNGQDHDGVRSCVVTL